MDEAMYDLKSLEPAIPIDILSDLLSRFIINVPETAKQNLIRICFQIELAYWYYLDFYVGNDENLKNCSLREFAALVFKHLPYLQVHYDRLPVILEEWREYKQSVPTYGAIILSEGNTHVLLVQSYWAKSSWGFPKGKVNEDEDPAHCAIREVYEETGFNINEYLHPETFFESIINEQLVRLYVISGVSMETKFQPRTRYEIKAIEWFPVADLPNNKKDATPKVKMGVSPNSFFMVLPFVKRIKSFCNHGKSKRQRQKSSSLSENEGTTKNKSNEADKTGVVEKKSREKRGKKNYSKRLFNNNQEEFTFTAPSWLNFKCDRAAIMECIP